MNLTFRRAFTSLSRRLDHFFNAERRKDITNRILKLQGAWDTLLAHSPSQPDNAILLNEDMQLMFADLIAVQIEEANPYYGSFKMLRVQAGLEKIREQIPGLIMRIDWPQEKQIAGVAIYRDQAGTARIDLLTENKLLIRQNEVCLVHYRYASYRIL